MPEPFEIRRRTGLYLLLAAACFAVAAGYGWRAYDQGEPLLWALTAVFGVLGFIHLRGLRDARTPLFVADDHGVRMRAREGWVGLLWSEMGEIRIERRIGVRYDPRVKVVSRDGTKFYTSPLGLATNVSPGEAEVQLARRRSAAAY
ncbi:hypothetical protein ASE12_04670 [Aeromicrobium sp. Root236]|uniref:hypothetical protein n=1 Tax=Aeromicrobium sp. Root236 TaxID=1736498 RepID=UPI0006F9FFCE|nr:hypothetical protein [Aeromicrobium sp. Root236]KRC64119.1 hypothetical protein ASE12_04670 [Aeromicrobium sp. Root236]